MKINIRAKNLEITPAINDYVFKRVMSVEKFLGHLKEIVDAAEFNVEIEKTTQHHKEGDYFKAEVVAHVNGHNFNVKSEKEDLYQAIDDVKDELARVLESRKEKRVGLIRRGGAKLKNLLRLGEVKE
jgi:putative sigma-54 modulation protein